MDAFSKWEWVPTPRVIQYQKVTSKALKELVVISGATDEPVLCIPLILCHFPQFSSLRSMQSMQLYAAQSVQPLLSSKRTAHALLGAYNACSPQSIQPLLSLKHTALTLLRAYCPRSPQSVLPSLSSEHMTLTLLKAYNPRSPQSV